MYFNETDRTEKYISTETDEVPMFLQQVFSNIRIHDLSNLI